MPDPTPPAPTDAPQEATSAAELRALDVQVARLMGYRESERFVSDDGAPLLLRPGVSDSTIPLTPCDYEYGTPRFSTGDARACEVLRCGIERFGGGGVHGSMEEWAPGGLFYAWFGGAGGDGASAYWYPFAEAVCRAFVRACGHGGAVPGEAGEKAEGEGKG